jgi:glycosyltransferase involved in cell wall biosynthesis
LRNYPYHDYPMAYGSVGYLMARVHCAALRRLTKVVVVSVANRDAIDPHGVSASVVPNGVALDDFSVPSPALRSERRRSLGLPQSDPVVVTVGALSERKQPGVAIAAALEEGDSHIVVVGDGPIRGALEHRYGDHPRVYLVGALGGVQEVLQAADIFISMSHAEGLPNAVMEAMACGLPCVLSDIPPHREMLDAAAAPIGELVPAGDAFRAGAALRRVYQARDAMGEAAHAHSLGHYAASSMAARYAALYEQLAGQRKSEDEVRLGEVS